MTRWGYSLKVVVHRANLQDRDGAKLLLQLIPLMWRLRLLNIWADRGYRGKLVGWCWRHLQVNLDIVSPPPGQKGFVLVARRWVIERIFAWLGRYRRLSKDYEELPYISKSMTYIAMIQLMLKRLHLT